MPNTVSGPLAIIDLGAHGVRMDIVQVAKTGAIENLENLSYPIFLGSDVFRQGKISFQNMQDCANIFSDFARVMKEYGVTQYKAIATSAVRESSNRDLFINKIKMESGIQLTVLESAEEIKLYFLTVKKAISKKFGLKDHNAIMCSIGTGSTNLAIIEKGNLRSIHTLKFGTMRLIEEISPSFNMKLLKNAIDPAIQSLVDDISTVTPIKKFDLFIVVGATVRALVNIGRENIGKEDIFSVSSKKALKILDNVGDMSPEEMVKTYNISDTIAFGIEPCRNFLTHLLNSVEYDKLVVPSINTKQIVLKDFIRSISGRPDNFDKQIISAVKFIGEKYQYNEKHETAVSNLAVFLFDKLKPLHKLGHKERLYLEIAALLCNIGKFVNFRQHHKHSYYIIKNSPIAGLSAEEQNIIAVITRYHRKASPKEYHPEYISLSPEQKILVCKLASILKIADSLERPHTEKINISKVCYDDEKLEIVVSNRSDLSNELWMVKSKCGLFTETYGMEIILTGK
jgi:exopolyphosphatase/guanosine-5'-triphosphate,3'-diphosphate pyrophosphatase